MCFTDNIREQSMNEKYKNRFAHQPRVRKFFNYDFFFLNGEFRVKKIFVNMRNKSIKNAIREYKNARDKYIARTEGCRESFEQINEFVNSQNFDLPLPINKVSKIVGTFKFIKHQPRGFISKKEFGDRSVINYGLSMLCAKFIDSIRGKNVGVFKGDFMYNSRNLVEMCTVPFREYTCKELIDGYFSRIGIDLVLPRFDKYDPYTILSNKVNYKAKPGIMSRQLVGQSRNITTKYSKRIAFEYVNRIMNYREKYVLDKTPYCCGGREKRVSADDNQVFKRVKTRMVFMQEDVPTLIGQSLSTYLMHGLQFIDKGFNYGGRLNGRQNWMKFLNVMHPREWFIINGNADFSGHDNHVTENKIVVAVGMLRLSFPESEEIDRLFYYVMSSMIFKRVVLPESNLIYEITKGLPSGHGLTSIVTTLIAYGTFSTAINNVQNKEGGSEDDGRRDLVKKSFIYNAGDDVAYRIDARYVHEIYDEIRYKSGMLIDELQNTMGYFISRNVLTRTTFLKKKYGGYRFSWNDNELFMNIRFPTIKSLTFGNLSNSLEQIIQSAPYDVYVNNIVKILCCALILDKNVNTQRNKKLKRIEPAHKYDGIYTPPPDYGDEATRFLDYVCRHVKLENENINKIILAYDFKFFSFYDPRFDEYVDVNIKDKVVDLIKNHDKIVKYKRRLLMTHIPFKMHRKVHRLAVFDLHKRYISPVECESRLIVHI